MTAFRAALAGLLALLTASAAVAQTFPTVPDRTVIGRLGVGGSSGPSQAIPFATFFANAGFVTLPITSGDVTIFDGATGKIKDSGVAGTFKQPVSYPSNITSGHSICAADSDCQFGNVWSQYPFGIVSANPLIIGKSGSTIGSTTLGQTFKIVFTSTGLTGSPITKTYTAGAGETTTTIAVGLCALVNADTVLHGTGGKPIFCQSLGAGVFNLQYDSTFSATGTTPLTTATTGSTGTITLAAEVNALDYIVFQMGRAIPAARPGAVGDGLFALDFTGQDSTGTFNTHYGQITIAISSPTAGATRGKMIFNTAGGSEGYFDKGLALFDTSGVIASGGTLGLGSINLPSVGKYSIDNVNNIRRNSGAGQFIIETTNADHMVLATGGGGFGFNATPAAGTFTVAATYISTNENAAPGSPAASNGRIWYDSTDHRLHDKNPSGTIGTTVVAAAAVSNQFVTAISAAGVVTQAQPSVSNLSGFGTGVATALGVNVGSAGAFVTFNGALGTPSSGTVTNLTGTASININGTVGATTPTTIAATTLTATGTSSLGPGGTGTTAGNVDFLGSSGAAGGVNTRWLKNGTLKWQHGFLNTLLASGTSDDMAFYRAGSAVFALTFSSSDDSTSVGATTASSSSTTGALKVAGGAGVAGDVWASGNHAVDVAAKTLVLKRGANGAYGTFICTSGGSITVSNTNVAVTDTIIISLNTAGGTISNAPALNAITAATSFVAKCATSDTSTYNYAIIKNAA